MGVDTAVLGGETGGPAKGWYGSGKAVSFFFNQPIDLSFIDNRRSIEQVPLSIWTEPTEPHRCGVSQEGPLPLTLGDTSFPLPLPSFLQAPPYFFGRESTLVDLLSLAERSASVALFGAGGIGKTAVALKLLHHHQILIRFGKYRYFIRCDDLEHSLDGFLERLSEAIGFPRPTDTTQLLSHFEASPPCILVLDAIDYILDPLAPAAAEISKTIAEFGRCQKVCILSTSRMDPKIPGFRHRKIPMFHEEAARKVFHSSCRLERSAVIDTILAELDFHPLSIALLASAVSENEWDGPALLEAWNNGKMCILRGSGREGLEDNIESIFRTPTIRELGTTAQQALEAIADSPRGVKETRLLNVFPEIGGIEDAVDALCKFSLMYRQDGFVKMHSPFRLYFQDTRRVVDSGSSLSFRLSFCHWTTFPHRFLGPQPREHPPGRLGGGTMAEPRSCLFFHPFVIPR